MTFSQPEIKKIPIKCNRPEFNVPCCILYLQLIRSVIEECVERVPFTTQTQIIVGGRNFFSNNPMAQLAFSLLYNDDIDDNIFG